MSRITPAYNLIVNACNDNNIGYSQSQRTTIQLGVSNRTYCDCSSIISWALYKAGILKDNPWFTTYNMADILRSAGFTKHDINTTWIAGDILLSNEHTEMVHTPHAIGGITMGAHNDTLPFKEQVSINNYATTPSYYRELWRLEAKPVPKEWIKGNRYLSLKEMENNALIINDRLGKNGWTSNAIAAVLGNMQTESTINPWIWEGLKEGNLNGGYGLTQWTPASKYINWAGGEWKNPENEIKRLLWEVSNNQQWFSNPNAPTPSPPITFKDFTKSSLDVKTLANYFLWYYEHPAVTIQPDRGTQAEYWLKIIRDNPPISNEDIPIWGIVSNLKYRKII